MENCTIQHIYFLNKYKYCKCSSTAYTKCYGKSDYLNSLI